MNDLTRTYLERLSRFPDRFDSVVHDALDSAVEQLLKLEAARTELQRARDVCDYDALEALELLHGSLGHGQAMMFSSTPGEGEWVASVTHLPVGGLSHRGTTATAAISNVIDAQIAAHEQMTRVVVSVFPKGDR